AVNQTVECDGNGNIADLNAWLVANGGASSSDDCSSVTWSNDFTTLSDLCGATGSATVTFTATDDCGNASSTTATFTIQDTTAPTLITQAVNQTVECDGNGNIADLNAWLVANGGASSSDDCSAVTWSNDFTTLSDLCGATGSATVTFTATDDCGNSSTTSATFTIQDTTNPVIDTMATDLTVECDGAGNSAQLNNWLTSNGGAIASDVCGGVTWSNDFSNLSGDCGASGNVTVTFTATDDCGNFSVTTATLSINDNTPPTIDTAAVDLVVECNGAGNTAELNAWLAANGNALASDSCSNVTWSNDFTTLSDLCGATGSATVTFTATDDCGNSSTTSATFTIQDTTNPVIDTMAADLTVECDGAGNSAQLNNWLTSNGGAIASDVCGGVTWSNDFTTLSDLCGATGSATVTFTATDDCGNTSSTTATFTIQDTTAPTIDTLATDLVVECDGAGNTAELNAWLATNGGAVASDMCGGVTWTNDFTMLSDDCGSTGSAIVTFTATDNCGNIRTVPATVTIQDTTPPAIDTLATNLVVECDGAGNTAELNAWLAANGNALASDTCSNVTWSNDFTALSDLCGATGSATVTFTATDDCGNTSLTTATFTIQDTTNPVVDTVAADLTVECDGAGNTIELNAWLTANGNALASDTCSNVTWSNDFTALSDLCGATGSATVTFTATDDCGNTSSTTATFTIQDTTPPTIDTLATNLVVECDGAGNTAELNAWLMANGNALASDTCSNVTWSNDFTMLSDDCGQTGSATVTFTATDDCGNIRTVPATFTIQDTTPPTIDTLATDLVVECDGAGNTAELNAWLATNGNALASDTCSNVTWSNDFTVLSDDCGLTGSATVTFTATDDCGNTSSTTATFTIQDTTSPVFTSILPDNESASCDAIPAAATLTGSDDCSTSVSIDMTEDIITTGSSCPGEYEIVRIWTVTDECGNFDTHTQIISVYDDTPPTLVTPLDTEITTVCSAIPEIPELVFEDNCSGINEVVYEDDTTFISMYNYIITRKWTVDDNCGNVSEFTQTINVNVVSPFQAATYSACKTESRSINLLDILRELIGEFIEANGEWIDVNGTGALLGDNFTIADLINGYYTLQYIINTENNPCPKKYEVYVNVNEQCLVLPACSVEVYNAVSPNNDGANDYFFIDGIECYPDNTVEIYNRWGILVYEATGYDNNAISFKGYSEGRTTLSQNETLPDGTYFYVLKYKDDENVMHDKSGYLYLDK
ncbi:gliding motility-associated C-terminal domain-containing protein, partial [Flavobacterium chuncheonense]